MQRPERPITEQADDVYWRAYNDVAGHLNRAARRTLKGKLLVKEAELKAANAKIAFLEERVKYLQDGIC